MSQETPEHPKALYHYTSQTGLVGIIRDRTAWATNICHMNDAREFNYARELLYMVLETFEFDENEHFANLVHSLKPATWDIYPNIFVFSMSKHHDRLGLWRAYSGRSTGYSVGFSTAELKAICERAGFRLVRCTYNKEEQQRLILELIQDTRSWINSFDENRLSMLRDHATEKFWEAFAILAAQIKHPAFFEEDEWRLVSDGMYIPRSADEKPIDESKHLVFDGRKINVRTGPSTLTPYVDLPLANTDGLLPIYHILAGPSIDPERAVHGVQMLLYSHNQHSQKSVHGSTIPYRTW